MRYQKELTIAGAFIAGTAIGAGIAWLVQRNRPQNPSHVLQQTKEYFGSLGVVKGAWIDYDTIEYDLFDNAPMVYIGGVTVAKDDQLVYYQFASDAITGDVIDYSPMQLSN